MNHVLAKEVRIREKLVALHKSIAHLQHSLADLYKEVNIRCPWAEKKFDKWVKSNQKAQKRQEAHLQKSRGELYNFLKGPKTVPPPPKPIYPTPPVKKPVSPIPPIKKAEPPVPPVKKEEPKDTKPTTEPKKVEEPKKEDAPKTEPPKKVEETKEVKKVEEKSAPTPKEDAKKTETPKETKPTPK
jgi:hypothetical protein